MLEIVNGSLDKIKAELKQVKKWKSDEEKNLKKEIKAWIAEEKKAAKEEKRNENKPPKEFDQKLMELEGLQKMFSSIIPVRVDEIAIDFKSYQKVVSKLKEFELYIKVIDRKLIINYGIGTVHLYDVSTYFKDLQHIPFAEISDGQEA